MFVAHYLCPSDNLEAFPHMAQSMPDARFTCKHIKNHNPEQIYSLGLMPAVDTRNHYVVLVHKARRLDTGTERHVAHDNTVLIRSVGFLVITTDMMKMIKRVYRHRKITHTWIKGLFRKLLLCRSRWKLKKEVGHTLYCPLEKGFAGLTGGHPIVVPRGDVATH